MKKYVEESLAEEQTGFRSGRIMSTQDNRGYRIMSTQDNRGYRNMSTQENRRHRIMSTQDNRGHRIMSTVYQIFVIRQLAKKFYEKKPSSVQQLL